jgi:hypothetical protein
MWLIILIAAWSLLMEYINRISMVSSLPKFCIEMKIEESSPQPSNEDVKDYAKQIREEK